jgi:sugar phosphate isomerase/epimerase
MVSVEHNLYISTSCIDGERNISSVLRRLASLGILNVELSAPHPYVLKDDLIKELLYWREQGMSFLLHNYFPSPENDFVLNLASFNEDIHFKTVGLVSEALELANIVGSPIYGCHAGYLADAIAQPDGTFSFTGQKESHEKCVEQVAATIKEIFTNNIKIPHRGILLENLFPLSRNETFSLACDPQEIKYLFDFLNDSRVGLLLDLAHLELTCQLKQYTVDKALDEIIDSFSDKILEIHLSGHDGKCDMHSTIKSDSWQVAALKNMKSLLVDNKDICITLESRKLTNGELLNQIELLNETLS